MDRTQSRRVSSRAGELRRTLAVTIGLCALFLNALAGIALSRHSPSPAFNSGAEVPAWMVICTPNGLQSIDPKAEPGDGGSDIAKRGLPACIFCLPLLSSGLGGFGSPLALCLPSYTEASLGFARVFALAHSAPHGTFWPTGPPTIRPI